MRRNLSIAGLVIVTAIWGGGFVASDIALDSLTPMQIMTIRFFLATLVLGLVSIRDLHHINRGEMIAGSLMGVSLFAGFALQIVGLQYTTLSKNAFLTSLNVVMVPFIAFIILHKRVSWRVVVGACLSVLGVGILSLNGCFALGSGDALTILCAVGFAFQIFLTGMFVKRYRASILNFLQMAVAFALSLVGLLFSGQVKVEASAPGWWSVLYLGLISTSLCYLIQTLCQRYVEETKAAIILSMEAVFGTIFSILFLHEHVTVRMIAGSMIILVAVIITYLADSDNAEPDREKVESRL